MIIDPGQSNTQKMKSSKHDGYFSCSVLRRRFAMGVKTSFVLPLSLVHLLLPQQSIDTDPNGTYLKIFATEAHGITRK